MRFSTLLSSAALMYQAVSAESVEYKDADTGITFQQYTDKSSKFTFGIALPKNPSTDFIGQMTVPISEGYGSVVRQADGYTNPAVLDDDTVSIKPIEKGTKVGTDSFTFTFLCEGCIKTDGTTFKAADTNAVLSFAMSTTALDDPTDSAGALNYHGAGFGGYSLDTAAAQSADFETWAKLASDATTPGTSPGGSTGSNPGNFTTIVSNATYDYIVVGGGTAGLIVAERLVESKKSVLLLEQGKASFYESGGRSTMDWNDTVTQYDVPSMAYYLTTAKDTSAYCTDTASMAGCILGGSSVINAMMFVRPQPADFDDKWPTGWKWQDVQSSADKLYERTPGTTSPTKDGKRVDQGAWNVLSKFFSGNGFTEVDAIQEPSKKKSVFTHPPLMVNDGLRAGPVRDYLPLAQANSNFKLQLNTKVLRVIREGKAVTGIEVQSGPSTRQIINLKSNGAVVLAAGALATPRLLVNSGIGPSEQVEAVASGSQRLTMPAKDQWLNLPVGENLKDHPIFTVKMKTKQPMSALSETDFPQAQAKPNIDLFAQGRRVPMVSSDTSQGTCAAAGDDAVKVKVYLTHGATSSGSLTVTSSGATKLVGEPYLKTAGDKEAVKSFMNKLISFASKPNSTLSIASNATAESLMAEYVSGSHFVGSAVMGTENDGTSVVDTDTKVWGTENLFVVDGSIHPDLPTGNTQAIIMVAAEHAASKILGGGNGAASPVVPSNGTVPVPTTAISTPVATKRPSKCKRSMRQRRHHRRL
uniref:Glucose-methanol-choline oxidoreductase N-terminal domain-containing protein n=1 Tax=Fusarium oxysporum (strain Fo5176) TaxID=660025 RepID=A0A0D2Y0J2_FUSOF